MISEPFQNQNITDSQHKKKQIATSDSFQNVEKNNRSSKKTKNSEILNIGKQTKYKSK